MTGYPEVMPPNNFQRRGPEVGFEEIAIDFLEARSLDSFRFASDPRRVLAVTRL